MLGITAMLKQMTSNKDTVDALKYCLNKTISKLELLESVFYMTFTDGTKLKIWDDGQCCCEDRYITCDDELDNFIDAVFTDIIEKSCDDLPSEDGYHEIEFINIVTSKGDIQLVTHNEHNGYYGGFALEARIVK